MSRPREVKPRTLVQAKYILYVSLLVVRADAPTLSVHTLAFRIPPKMNCIACRVIPASPHLLAQKYKYEYSTQVL